MAHLTYHRRQLNAVTKSAADAKALHDILAAAAKVDPNNGYLADAAFRAHQLAEEMADELEEVIFAAVMDGLTPDDLGV